MKMVRVRLAFLFACLFTLTVVAEATAKDKWINIRTKNFNVVSNADEGDTKEVALKLEQFVYVFSQIFNLRSVADVPVTVMVFKSDGSFKPFKPLYNGKPANVAGYFQRGEDENVITLNISANQQRPFDTIFHEYTHLLTSYTPTRWPVWLTEGIAEFYSSFDVNKNKVTIGAPIDSHVFRLRENKLIPLPTLFSVDHNSPVYNEREKQGIFYAESWALIHYLMMSERSARQKQLGQFVKLLESGMSVDKAFPQAFQTDFATMEKDLQRYVGNDRYNVNIYMLDSTEGDKQIDLRPLSEAEAQAYLGNLLMRTNRLDEAEPYFQQAIALDQTLTRPYEGLGFTAIRRQKYDEAIRHLEQATARDSKNYLAHYYYAMALYQNATRGLRNEMPSEVTAKIIAELTATTALKPNFAPPYSLLGHLYFASGDKMAEAASALKTAIRLTPQNKSLRLLLAQAQTQLNAFEEAKKTLAPLLTDETEPGLKRAAESMQQLIESYTRPAPSTDERTANATTAPPPPRLQNNDGARASQPDSSQPAVRLPDTETMSGVLAAMECIGNGKLVLVLKVGDKVIRFLVSDPVNLKFFSQVPGFSADIGCGAINLPALIYYKPFARPNAQYAGDAVAVEFKK